MSTLGGLPSPVRTGTGKVVDVVAHPFGWLIRVDGRAIADVDDLARARELLAALVGADLMVAR